jgi:type IV pilus assembly protein PilA
MATDTRGSYVTSVEIVNGRVDVTYGGPLAHQDIIGPVLSLTPSETSSNSISCRCGNAPAPQGALLSGGSGHVAPTVDLRYLPATRR